VSRQICCVLVPDWSSTELLHVEDFAAGRNRAIHALSWKWAYQGFAGSFAERFDRTAVGHSDLLVGAVAQVGWVSLPQFLGASVHRYRNYATLIRGINRLSVASKPVEVDIRTYPYDWRRPREELSQDLQVFVKRLIQTLPSHSIVVLIGHGVGGQIAAGAKGTMKTGEENEGVIVNVISIGTAWRGAIGPAVQLANGLPYGPAKVARVRALRCYPSSAERGPSYPRAIQGSVQRRKLSSDDLTNVRLAEHLTSRDLVIFGRTALRTTPLSARLQTGHLRVSQRSRGDRTIPDVSADIRCWSTSGAKVCSLELPNHRLLTNKHTMLVVQDHLRSLAQKP
jgi:pimeloyl-ACP methyl ester carboxylesterase